jgi:RTX toxin acyltransferase family
VKPIGVAFWATVNEEVEARLAAGTTRMRPQDWKSGDRLWVVEVIAPFGGAEEMVKDLKLKVFPQRELKFLQVGPKGREASYAKDQYLIEKLIVIGRGSKITIDVSEHQYTNDIFAISKDAKLLVSYQDRMRGVRPPAEF